VVLRPTRHKKRHFVDIPQAKKLKPHLVASYDIRPGNGDGPFLSRCFTNLLLTYLDTYRLTYSPALTRGTCLATDLDESSSHLKTGAKFCISRCAN